MSEHTPPDDDQQASIDPFRELNRYDGRDEDWPSDAVFEPPRRTVANGWRKFHSARDCGFAHVRFVEADDRRYSDSERWDWNLYCANCRHEVPEDEVLFIGGQWFQDRGHPLTRRTIDDLWLPSDRILELGPDPDESELVDALELTRIERQTSFVTSVGLFEPDNWKDCEECGHAVPLRFEDRCRMCYDGPWSDRLQSTLYSFERALRSHHNNSFVHRLPTKVDPLAPGDTVGRGQILWRRHDQEGTSKLVVVTQRLVDKDSGHTEYALEDPTLTERWQYHEEGLQDCFWDTGLNCNEATKPIENDRVREAYQRVCDHSFTDVHDAETGAVIGEQCIHCRLSKEDYA